MLKVGEGACRRYTPSKIFLGMVSLEIKRSAHCSPLMCLSWIALQAIDAFESRNLAAVIVDVEKQ